MAKCEAWVQAALAQIQAKMAIVTARNPGVIPYTTDASGRFIDLAQTDPTWWANGFWGAMQWQLFQLTGDSRYQQGALKVQAQLAPNLMQAQRLDHDNGFKWQLTAVLAYQKTQDPAAFNQAQLAAANLAGRFNLNGRFLRAWNDNGDGQNAGVVIIDTMMNLPLLYWASTALKDPRYRQLAMAHADTTQRYFVRPDGSVKHLAHFDPESGDYLYSEGGQGYAHGSSWSLGQAFGLYGFALSYQHTGKKAYLDTACRIANYVLANLPEDALLPSDLRAPQTPRYVDDIATATCASGLLTLAGQQGLAAADSQGYSRFARRMLQALIASELDLNPDHDYLLRRCNERYHEKRHDYTIIYADYFLLEALMKLAGTALAVW